MRAATVQRYKDDPKVTTMPDPVVGPGELLVEVDAAGVNPLDFKIRDGALRPVRRFRFPLVLGGEIAGRVLALGDGATRFAVGDAVYARLDKRTMGGFAERVSVREAHAAHAPKTIGPAEAAGVPLAALTAWQALDKLDVKAGTRLLVHAGAGGVGSFAVQFARLRGAWIATTASARNAAYVTKLGADLVIDYTKERFETKAGELEAVFDTIGGDTLDRSIDALRPGGRVVSISGPPDASSAGHDDGFFPWTPLLFTLASMKVRRRARKAGVSYSYMFMKPDGARLAEIASLIDEGRVSVSVEEVFPLERTAEAFTRLAGGHTRGKLVVTPKP